MSELIVPRPCFRLNGELWFEEHTPTAADVTYHQILSGIVFPHVRPHIREALKAYNQTITGLIAAGF